MRYDRDATPDNIEHANANRAELGEAWRDHTDRRPDCAPCYGDDGPALRAAWLAAKDEHQRGRDPFEPRPVRSHVFFWYGGLWTANHMEAIQRRYGVGNWSMVPPQHPSEMVFCLVLGIPELDEQEGKRLRAEANERAQRATAAIDAGR